MFCRNEILKEDQLTHYSTTHATSVNCSHYYSLECPGWLLETISDDPGPIEGKIYCPNCHHKLGQFSWYGMYIVM